MNKHRLFMHNPLNPNNLYYGLLSIGFIKV